MAGLADYAELTSVQDRAVRAWRDLQQPEGLAKALLNAGNVKINNPSGDPSENAAIACKFYEEALECATENGNYRLEAACHFSLAMGLRDRSGYEPDEDLANAASHLERAIEIYQKDEDRTEWAEAVAALASLQVNERARYRRPSQEALTRVIALLRVAIEHLPSSEKPSSRASALFYLGQAFLEEESETSIREASNAFDAARKLRLLLGAPLDVAHVEEAEANALSDLTDASAQRKATRLYRSAVKRLGSSHPLDRFRIQRNMGFARMQEGAWRSASRALQEAVRIAADSEFLKLSRHGLFREGDISECHSSRAYCELRLGHCEEALNLLERGRQISEKKIDQDLDLKRVLAALEDEFVVIPILTPVGSAAILIGPGNHKLSRTNVIDLPGIDQLYASLHPNRSRGRAGWLQSMAVWRGDQSSQNLGSRMRFLDDLLAELWTGFAQPVLASRSSPLGGKLIVVPQGGLQIFPIHAAYREENGRRRYVATDWTVRYVPSLTFLQHSTVRKMPNPDKRLAIGLGRYCDPRLRKLALAEAEAKAISSGKDRQMIGQQLCGDEVTRDRLLSMLNDVEMLHFACHATWNSDPQKCALQFWARRSGEREELTRDIVEQNLNLRSVRLTVLSACESGVIEHIFAPDEFAGLPGAFLKAGSAGVISSLWVVHDLASFLLWTKFYERLSGTELPEQALADAQRWLRQLTVAALRTIHLVFPTFEQLVKQRVEVLIKGLTSEQKPFSHPLLWAPFVYYGA
jgi:CHAT domain-containing protein/tetratricopeptide (TPR) repeat protein